MSIAFKIIKSFGALTMLCILPLIYYITETHIWIKVDVYYHRYPQQNQSIELINIIGNEEVNIIFLDIDAAK